LAQESQAALEQSGARFEWPPGGRCKKRKLYAATSAVAALEPMYEASLNVMASGNRVHGHSKDQPIGSRHQAPAPQVDEPCNPKCLRPRPAPSQGRVAPPVAGDLTEHEQT